MQDKTIEAVVIAWNWSRKDDGYFTYQFGTKQECNDAYEAILDDFDRKLLMLRDAQPHTPLDIVRNFCTRAASETDDYKRAIAELEDAFVAQQVSVSQALEDCPGDGYGQAMATFYDGWTFGTEQAIADVERLHDFDMSNMGADYKAGYRRALQDILGVLSAPNPIKSAIGTSGGHSQHSDIDTSDANFQQGYADAQHTRAVSYNELSLEQLAQLQTTRESYEIDWSSYDDDEKIFIFSHSGQFVGFTFEQ